MARPNNTPVDLQQVETHLLLILPDGEGVAYADVGCKASVVFNLKHPY